MISETAKVLDVEDEMILIEVLNKSSCSGCQAEGQCGTNILGRLFSSRHSQLKITKPNSTVIIYPGDRVEIAVEDNAVILASIVGYVFPLFGLFLGMFSALMMFNDYELAGLLGGVVGLIAGLIIAKKNGLFFSRKIIDLEPKIISINGISFLSRN